MTHCRECRGKTSDEAPVCPRCGAPKPALQDYKGSGFEWASKATLFGVPLVHVAFGRDRNGKRRVAGGIVAVGQFGIGVVTVAQIGVGLIGIGQFIVGMGVIAQVAFASVASLGQFATGAVLCIGQFAAGAPLAGQVVVPLPPAVTLPVAVVLTIFCLEMIRAVFRSVRRKSSAEINPGDAPSPE